MAQPDALKLRVHSITFQTDRVVVYELRDVNGAKLPDAEPGSHVDVHLGGDFVRSYSLVDAEDPWRYCIAVAREESGRGGSRWMHRNLHVGDLAEVSAPRNNFVLEPDAAHSVLIAGGIGITPIYAMLRRLEARGAPWELHYSSRGPVSTAFYHDLSKRFGSGTITFYHSRTGEGRIDFPALLANRPPRSHFYCCGPTGMIDAFLAAASALPGDMVHVERFGGTVEVAQGGFEAVLAQSNRILRVGEGETILGCLLAAGIDVPHSCREGVCGACETRLLEGTGDHRDLIQSDAEKAANKSIFVCCSGSLTPSLTLDI